MSLRSIVPFEARKLIDEGAILVDVREAKEHARENIPGARLQPLSAPDSPPPGLTAGKPVIFHCQSGARTSMNARRLAARLPAGADGYVLAGGIEAWRRAGLPTGR
ncbi:MAG: sulfurtransferase [Bauldia sp.]|nr:sulfurtransferase [Bauldia sp.]MCW5718373.1 sulfurtransferase [Bauldia sp.]